MPSAWWLILAVVSLAAGLVFNARTGGFAGAGASLAGVAVAVAAMGPICWMGGMGMGDLKLCAAIGAWIGPAQMLLVLVITGIAGGIIAVVYALRRKSLGRSLDGTAALAGRLLGKRSSQRPSLDSPGALAIPYAPAIAVGTLFAYLAG